MSQPQITSVVSKATVAKLVSSERQTEKLDQSSENKVCNKKANEKSNPSKRPRTCISDSSGHYVCIEKDLEEIMENGNSKRNHGRGKQGNHKNKRGTSI